MVGHTHRLTHSEWRDFLKTPLTENQIENPLIFANALPRPLTKNSSHNLENFQLLSCDRYYDNGWGATFTITCVAWQPNEIPSLGAIDRFPRFSAGNQARFAYTDIFATENTKKLQISQVILESATTTFAKSLPLLAGLIFLVNF